MKLCSKHFIGGVLALAFLASPLMAATSFTFTDADGKTVTVNINDDTIASIIRDNKDTIQQAITDNGVKENDINSAVNEVNTLTADGTFGTGTYDTLTDSLTDFGKDLLSSVQAGQTMQNQWANAYIGSIFPGFHLGAGVNVGVSTLKMASIKTALEELDMGGGDEVPDNLVFPSITADLRIGGLFLPFDLGFTVMKIDTSNIGSLKETLNGLALDYFVIGGDIRYCLFQGPLNSKVSLTGGFYYTKVDFGYESDSVGAGINLGLGTVSLGAQASAKLLFFVPYVGARVLFSFGSNEWYVKPDWASLLGETNTSGVNLSAILPETFSGKSSVNFFENIRPQLYAGFGLDLFVVDVTLGVSYTLISNVLGATVSVRLAWD